MATLCKTTVLKVYLDVIEEVITGVREFFIEDGVDEQILQELKLAWETKLKATKAVENQNDVDKQGLKKLSEVSMTNGFPKQQQQQTQQQQQQQQAQQQQQQAQQQQQQVVKQVVGQVPPNNHVQTQSVAQILEAKMVPIQITLPVQPGTDAPPRVLTIQVPASALQGNQLHKVLTGPVITATMSLPQPIASQMLQQHVNAAFSQPQQLQQQQQQQINVRQINKTVIQSDGTHMSDSSEDEAKPSTSRVSCLEMKKKSRRYVKQFDGPMDSSDEDEDGTEEDEGSEEADDDKEEDEQEVDEGGPEEEPLNSEDDVTDEDPFDLFDTENVVVCQYDKITRSRNKWKFHLKDGIMNLHGEDYLFQKASGDAEW